MVKEESTLINIAICDDDLVFASKIEAMLLQISKKQMIKMNIEVFSDGSELWDDIASGKNKDGAGKFYGKLNNIEKQLVDSKIPFLRIHQSYLVNYRFICKIIFYHVTYL